MSAEETGGEVDVGAVGRGEAGGVAHGDVLSAFVSAVVDGEPAVLDAARGDLVATVGEAGMVDAAAVVANFEMMTRLADGTGARHHDDSEPFISETAEALGVGGLTSRH